MKTKQPAAEKRVYSILTWSGNLVGKCSVSETEGRLEIQALGMSFQLKRDYSPQVEHCRGVPLHQKAAIHLPERTKPEDNEDIWGENHGIGDGDGSF